MSKFKEYILENYDEDQLNDIATHGCAGGVSGFIYYEETTAAYDYYRVEIWDKLYEDAEAFGHSNALEMIATFNGCKDVGSDEQFKNLLVWWFVESVAFEFLNRDEGDNDNE